MKSRSVVVLAVLVAALGAFVWFYERRQPSSEERTSQARRFVELEANAVVSLAIERPGQPTVRLERQGEGAAARWRITEPVDRRADRFAVDGLVRNLVELEAKRTIEDAAPADLGLETPRARLTWTTVQGSDTLLVGAEVPASGDTLVGLASRPGVGFVTAGTIAGELAKDAEGWRDRHLFPGERATIERIRIVPAGGTPIVLARHGESYRVSEPFDDAAERDVVEGLLGELTALSAQSFVADAEPAAPVATVEVSFGDGTPPFTLEVGPASGEGAPVAVRARSGTGIESARISTRLPETAVLPAENWRSRAWTSLASYDIDTVTVSGDPAGPLSLRRDGVDWKRGEEKISYTEVSDFLAAITSAAAATLTNGEAAAGASALTFELTGPKNARETLVLDGTRATSSVRPGIVLELSQEEANEVRKTLERVRSAKAAEG